MMGPERGASCDCMRGGRTRSELRLHEGAPNAERGRTWSEPPLHEPPERVPPPGRWASGQPAPLTTGPRLVPIAPARLQSLLRLSPAHSPSRLQLMPAQAGCAVLSRADGWNGRIVTSAWWVAADALTKLDGHGGRLPIGTFAVRGSRHYLPPSPPVMGFGVLFRVALPCVARHLDERRARGGANEVDDAASEGEDVPGGDEGSDAGDGDGDSDDDGNCDGGEAGATAGATAGGDSDGRALLSSATAESGKAQGGSGLQAVGKGAHAKDGSDDGEEAAEEEEEEEEGDEEEDGTTLRMLPGGGLRITAAAVPTVRLSAPSAAASVSEAPSMDVIDDISDPIESAPGTSMSEHADGSAGAGGTTDGTPSYAAHPNRLTAKQRRLLKKGRLGAAGEDSGTPDGAETAAGGAMGVSSTGGQGQEAFGAGARDGGARDGGRSSVRGEDMGAAAHAPRPPPVPAPAMRGKAGKQKKMKAKYAEQDEEERALCLELLGSAGKSKRQLRAEEMAAAAEAKRVEAEAKKARQAERQAREQERERQRGEQRAAPRAPNSARGQGSARSEGGASEVGETEEGDAGEAFAELAKLLAEPSMASLPAARRALVCAQDTLTAQPTEDDEIVFAVPVCAPYSALASYKYKLKLAPGNQKRGKAAKAAIGMLGAAASGRERELMRAVTDDELVRAMLSNVKVATTGKLLQAQKSAEKRERKLAATTRREEQQQGQLKEGVGEV